MFSKQSMKDLKIRGKKEKRTEEQKRTGTLSVVAVQGVGV